MSLTAWLFAQADLRQILGALSRVHTGWIAVAVGLVLFDRSLMAWRWLLLLRAVEPGRALPLGAVMRVFFVSTFIGTFLPASVGGDAVRAVGLSRLQVPAADAFASVIVDRLLGVLSVLLMAGGGLVVVHRVFDAPTVAAIGAIIAGVVVVSMLLLFDSRVFGGLTRAVTSRYFPRAGSVVTRLLEAIRQYGDRRRALGMVMAGSVAVQVLRTLQAWCLGLALGLPTGLVWYFAFVPLIILLMMLPISVAGIGTSQLGFQLLFGTAGVAESDALALSILFLALGLVGNLPGGWLFVFGSERPRSSA